MTDKQVKLLELFKEIDTICKNNDIEYYLAGGTLIGAVRHRGFVPWDDDIDLYMTKDNWLKFVEVCKTQIPPNRVLESPETDRAYYNMFARYVDKSSTAVHNAQMIYDDTAGFVIDILQLDPVESDKESYDKYIKDLMLYSDLINLSIVYSYRWDCNKYRYPLYELKSKIIGRDKVIEKLEKKLFSHPEENFTHYAMRWGGKPFLFPREWFTGVNYAQFVDVQAEVPPIISPYMTWHYGDEWMYIPPHGEQESHDAIYSLKHEYTPVVDEIHSMIDTKKYQKYYRIRKAKWLQYMDRFHDFENERRDMKIDSLRIDFNRYFAKNKQTILELKSSNKYFELFDIYKDYFAEQLSALLIGREDYVNAYRFEKPLFIDLADKEIFDIALLTLVNVEKISKAMRLIDVEEQISGKVTDVSLMIRADVTLFREAVVALELGNVSKSKELCQALLKKYPDCISFIKLMLHILKAEGLEANKKEIKALVKKGREIKHMDGDFICFEADLIFKSKKNKALLTYIDAYKNTENGLTHLDIYDVIEANMSDTLSAIEELSEKDCMAAYDYIEVLLELFPENEDVYEKKCQYIFRLVGDDYSKFVSFNKSLLGYTFKYPENTALKDKYISFINNYIKDEEICCEFYESNKAKENDEIKDFISALTEKIESSEANAKAWRKYILALNLKKIGEYNKAFEIAKDVYDLTDNELLKFFIIRYILSDIRYMSRSASLERIYKMNSEGECNTEENAYLNQWIERFATISSAVDYYSNLGIIPDEANKELKDLKIFDLESDQWDVNQLRILYKICFLCSEAEFTSNDNLIDDEEAEVEKMSYRELFTSKFISEEDILSDEEILSEADDKLEDSDDDGEEAFVEGGTL